MKRALRMLVAASALCGTAASATDQPKTKSDSFGSQGQSTGSSTDTSSAVGTNVTANTQNRTVEEAGGIYEYSQGRSKAKYWEVGAQFETHALVIQNDLEETGKDKLFNAMFFYARLDLTKNDRIRLDGGFYEYFIADPGESGFRAQDLALSYTHSFHLPGKIDLRARAGVTAPIGFYSQLAGLITAPSLSIDVGRDFELGGKKGGIGVNLRGGGTLFVQRYAEKEGGGPNPRASVGLSASVEYRFGVLPALSLGADMYTGYVWFFDIDGAPGAQTGLPADVMPTADSTYSSQPVQQVYCDEIFAHYSLPTWHGMKAAAQVAFAQGDLTLGCTSVLHDGVFHIYPVFWRLNSEVYGALSLRY